MIRKSVLAGATLLLSLGLAVPLMSDAAHARSERANPATGIGPDGTPPGHQNDPAGSARDHAPGHNK